VAKILVADDNSNVQKTVALALAGLGVEVVAVNNGDAAVRKLGDIMPDLVLADIFMPVRNGYEVCDFVKKDSRFSHVPVVLLVGAFDPLDEREAQRVAADGILKKPFVPPDPLIAMVKTLLDRSLNERLVAVGATTPAAAAQNTAAASSGAAKVEERTAPRPAPPVAAEPAREPIPEEELHAPVDRLSFDEGEAPVAFGQLLDPPVKEAEHEAEAIEPVEDDQVFTSARDANLGEPVFWKAEEPEAETEEGEAQAEEEGSADFSAPSWGLGEESLSAHSSGEETETAEPANQVESFELVRDGASDEEASPTVVETSASFAQDAASQASLHVQPGRPQDLAANPLDWMANAPAQHVEEAPAEEETETPWNTAETESLEQPEASEQSSEEEPIEEMGLAPEPFEPPAPPLPEPPPASSPIGTSPASFLGAPMPPARPPVPPPAPSASSQPKSAAPASDPNKTPPTFKSLEQSAEDTARSIPMQEWTDLAAGFEAPVAARPAEKAKPASPVSNSKAAAANSAPEPPSEAPADPNSPDPALVEAVVQRVLDKMRPQVVDIITKEFLRPVVQALVHREITKH
jgi:CheY-like chemotaxis protein